MANDFAPFLAQGSVRYSEHLVFGNIMVLFTLLSHGNIMLKSFLYVYFVSKVQTNSSSLALVMV